MEKKDTSKKSKPRDPLNKRYDFICCACGYEQWAKPSIMMIGFGKNSGCGSCLNCNQFLHLEIEGGLDGERMVSELWDDHLKRIKEKTLNTIKAKVK